MIAVVRLDQLFGYINSDFNFIEIVSFQVAFDGLFIKLELDPVSENELGFLFFVVLVFRLEDDAIAIGVCPYDTIGINLRFEL